MNDVLEELLEAVEEELDQGVSLVISSSAMPRGGSQSDEMTSEMATQGGGILPSMEMEDVLGASSGEDTSLGRGRGLAQAVAGTATTSDLIQRVASLARSAGVAQSLAQGGHGGRAAPSGTVAVAETSATTFSMASATRRQSVATVETARTVDRAIERDARRYDGGFVLG